MHPNAELLKRVDEAQLNGDLDTFFGSYTDDVVVHIAGKSSFAGDYKGKGELQALFERYMTRAGNFTFDNHAYLADDEHGVILQKSHYDRDGQRLDADDVFVAHIRNGKIAEFWVSSVNQDEVDAFLG